MYLSKEDGFGGMCVAHSNDRILTLNGLQRLKTKDPKKKPFSVRVIGEIFFNLLSE